MKVFYRLRFFFLCISFFLVGYYVQKINLIPKVALAVQGTLNLGSTIDSVTTVNNKTLYSSDMIFGSGSGGTTGVLSGTTGNIGIGVSASTVTGQNYLPGARLVIKDETTPGGEFLRLIKGTTMTRFFEDGSLHINRETGTGSLYMNSWGTIGLNNGLNVYTSNVDFVGTGSFNIYNGKSIKLWTGNGAGQNGIWDASTGNLGVGTTAPSATLQVGNASTPYSTAGLIVYGGDLTNSTTVTNFMTGSGTSALYVRGDGNVGINNTSPGQKLSVAGVIESTTGGFKYPNGSIQTTAAGAAGTTNYLSKFTGAADLGNSQIIDNGTNVGIGTTAPGAFFHVNGAAYLSPAFYDGSYGSALKIGYVSNSSVYHSISSTVSIGGATSNGLQFNVHGGGAVLNQVNALTLLGNGNVGVGTTNPGGVLDVNGKLTVIANGNVGIGSTGPAAKLDVAGTTSTISNTSGDVRIVPSANLLVTQGNVGIGSAVPGAKLDIGGVTSTIANGAGNMNITPAGNLLITQGNVGIGTTGPSAKLDVGTTAGGQTTTAGSLGLIRNATNADTSPYTQARMIVYGGTGIDVGNWGYFGYGADASLRIVYGKTGSGAPLYFGTSSAMDGTGTFTPNMTIQMGGNVGIGTTSPGQKLEVNGLQRFTSTGYIGSAGSMFTGMGAGDMGIRADGGLYLGTANSDPPKVAIISNGNVGIGSLSPATKLDVNGDAAFNSISKIGPASPNPERGVWNPIWSSIAAGKALYSDEEFANGVNSVSVYNNSGGAGVTHTWENGDGSQPNTSGKWIRIVNNGAATSPGLGGFLLQINSRRNATFVQRFRAKLPVGYTLNNAENSQGTNSIVYWLTPTAGTGKWEEYIRVSHSGNTGTFSSGGHVYVTGSPTTFTWYLASANVYEIDTPSSMCPIGMRDTGAGFCIDNADQTESAYGSSTNTCGSANKEVCSLSQFCTAYYKGVTLSASYRVIDGYTYVPNSTVYFGSANIPGACTTAGQMGANGGALVFRCCRSN